MAKIKIISNPYTRRLEYLSYKEQTGEWEEILVGNPDSKLREDESGKNFLPFKIKDIIDIIIAEYFINNKIEIVFEGTKDDFDEVKVVCSEKAVAEKIELVRGTNYLENARHIFEPTKVIFETVQPIIEKIIKDDVHVKKDLSKVADALRDIIPICVFGNYSAGKSTFINALIGYEVLPSGGDPVTAKVYKIERSKYDDNARIKFAYKEEQFEILFEGTEYRLVIGNVENELIQDIFNTIKESKTEDLIVYVNIALELINGYEKKDTDDVVISNVIELEIPFSKSGVLGQSFNNFVIFDTPGSNSASNAEHSKVLAEALEGFSNGIPVWISTYESIDSTDNGKLCDDILEIKALDKRFTMIIMNKADGSDLDEDGFTAKKEQEILEYSSVEKMYASGIYFVSSIMGIGAKNNGVLTDKHYRRIYRSQLGMYEDPEDEDYATLYKYNIMPRQIKRGVMEYSANCNNIVYANSGLYCVEREMENFASKHAAYNKCQMVYMFLREVIEETDKRIISRTESLRRTREARQRELDAAKAALIDSLSQTAETTEYEFDKVSRSFVKSFIEANLIYRYTVEQLEKITSDLRAENVEERHFEVQERGYEASKSKLISNFKRNAAEIFKGEDSFFDRFSKMKDDMVRDYSDYVESRGERAEAEKGIDKETSDELLQIVVEEYKKNILIAQEMLSNAIKDHWQQNAQSLRNILIDIITGSDALTSTQREELSQIIISYQPLEFTDDSENVFVKSRFLRGSVFGVQFFEDEKLNIKKLASGYNDKIASTIKEMASEMNASSYASFRVWKESLRLVIEENITEYNPQLRDMSDMIKEETEKIAELEENQATIQSSLNSIEGLMAWKVSE